jgi:uncharacterized protein DUF4349
MSANEMTVAALLRAHAPHAPESLRERVLALEPARQRIALPPRRLALVALPAAVGLAVVAALVHGVIGSGKKTTTVSLQQAQPPAAVTTPTWRTAPSVGAGGAGHLEQRLNPLPTAKKGFAPTVDGASRLQRTDASIEVSVGSEDDLAKATTRATQIATSLGGYAQSVDYHSRGTSIVELRVPAQNVKSALARLAGLGTIVSQNLSVTDLQQKLKTQSEQIAQLRRRVAALRAAVRDPSLPEAQKVLLQIRLSESKRALSQRLHAQKGTISAGTTARISVSIGTKKSIQPVAHPRGRLGRLVHSAVGFLALEGIIALYALIVISPIALVVGALWLWRRRSVDRLLAA